MDKQKKSLNPFELMKGMNMEETAKYLTKLMREGKRLKDQDYEREQKKKLQQKT